MASRGRGRKLPPSENLSPPGGLQSPASSVTIDPIGEAASADISAEMDFESIIVPHRPGFGTKGNEIKLITNHFEMKMPSTKELFRYDVEITQGTGSRMINWTSGKAFGLPRNEIRDRCYSVWLEYVKQCGLQLYEFAYDRQKTLYSLKDIKELGQMKSVVVRLGNETYTVVLAQCNPPTVVISPETIARTAVDTSNNTRDRSPLQILDLITNQFLFYMHAIEKTEYMHFGRYFYKPKAAGPRSKDYHYLTYGRMIYEGFFKSLRLVLGPNPHRALPSANGASVFLTLNVDSKKAPFFVKQNLVETVFATLNCEEMRPLNDQQIRQLNLHLKDLRVRTLHTNRMFVMCGFTSTPSNKQMIKFENGAESSVWDYFKKKYNNRMECPNLPCVRKRGCNGKPSGWTYFPIEMCEVVAHQKVDLKKSTEDQSRELIKCAAVSPEVRLRDIIEKAKNLDSCNGEVDQFSRNFGVQRSPELMRLNGRQLNTPKIKYAQNRTADVNRGQWNLNNQRVYMPAVIGDFAVCCFANNRDMSGGHIEKFSNNLIAVCRNLGITIGKFCGDYVKEENIDSVFRALSNTYKFLLCIMDDRSKGDRLKNAVKLAEVKYTVITQCVRSKTIYKCADKPNDEIYKNIALKVNCKNGGVNNEIDMTNDPIGKKWLRPGVMFVGMDVNHPPAMSAAEKAQKMEPKEPSVVGAVANCGKSISDYRMRYYLQDMRKEEVEGKHLKDMVNYFIDEYAENNDKKRPDSIIWFRDGVSESQFKMVLDNETIAVKQALASMNPPYNPKLTVITVQKRHNTRFFQEKLTKTDANQLLKMKNVEKNVPAGTVVDTGPVSAYLFDFYLCSHVGIQGTSKPTYYVVLLDENNFSADELQHLTFVLAHCYQRCTKSVSLPAPVYHAHHVATRGKANYMADNDAGDDSSSGISSASSDGSPIRSVGPINYDAIQSRIQYGLLNRDRMIWA